MKVDDLGVEGKQTAHLGFKMVQETYCSNGITISYTTVTQSYIFAQRLVGLPAEQEAQSSLSKLSMFPLLNPCFTKHRFPTTTPAPQAPPRPVQTAAEPSPANASVTPGHGDGGPLAKLLWTHGHGVAVAVQVAAMLDDSLSDQHPKGVEQPQIAALKREKTWSYSDIKRKA